MRMTGGPVGDDPGSGPEARAVRELTVHRVDLDAPPLPFALLREALSPEERARAGRMLPGRLQRRWIAARGLLRHLLAPRVGSAPRDLSLRTSPGGKPFVEGGPAFNLSHSGPNLLVAVAPSGRVGVDVEIHRDVSDMEAIARRHFTAAEVAGILAAASSPGAETPSPPDPQAGVVRFLRAWVRKEAFLKGVGSGLGTRLGAFEVATGPGVIGPGSEARTSPGAHRTGWPEEGPLPSGPNRLLRVELPQEDEIPWRLVDLPSPDGVEAALAWDDPGLHPVMRDWPLNAPRDRPGDGGGSSRWD